MKFKRLLALLLTLLLAMGIAPFAFAQEDEPLAPDPVAMTPVITQQPQGFRVSTVHGSTMPVRVQAHIPNGDTVGYRWYRNGELFTTHESITLSTRSPAAADYHVVVFNRDHPEYYITSETVRAEVYEASFFEKAGAAISLYRLPDSLTKSTDVIIPAFRASSSTRHIPVGYSGSGLSSLSRSRI